MNPDSRIALVKGDITQIAADAIVNAANQRMLGGGGVDGAIHRAAGPELRRECELVAEVRPGVRCPTGEARITKAYRLPARFVIHTAGPVWRGGLRGEDELLRNAYRSSLELARRFRARSISFPAISTGVFAFPIERACRIAIETIRTFLETDATIERVFLVAFGDDIHDAYEALLNTCG